jgi:hypothetical protein
LTGTCDGAGSTREVIVMPTKLASAIGEERGWKHLTRQLPISGQTFCGQSGQGLTGVWQGEASEDVREAMARAMDVVIGTEMSATTMAIRPRTPNQ